MQAQDINNLFSAIKKTGDNNAQTQNKLQNAVNSLSQDQKNKLDEILSSPEKMRELLSSDKAKEIMKKLGGEN
ncbi:MAG: hypothetical protein J1E34_08585 [Oscillospiraceae bacterium]|nr:hypothetical protein [Oscillospiraceae bacterium]